MNIVSFDFIAFLLVILVLYYICPLRYRWVVLLIGSLYFYRLEGLRALVTLLGVSVFVFFSAIVIHELKNNGKKSVLAVNIAVILIISWLVINKVTLAKGLDIIFIVFPLGISYVSFSLISYLVDVFMDRIEPERNILKFILFVFYFPKIIQGPIARYKETQTELFEGHKISYMNLAFGAQRILYGYFKKLVIADRLALFTTPVFADVQANSGAILVVASVFASFQLYCDFSGYMDIVLGFSQMLGIKMDENFSRPFFSKNSAEFWRRWHITLGTWFRDYIYTPLIMSASVKKLGKICRKKFGKKFGNSVMKIIALATVWILTGLWHGTGLNYVIWGAFWGTIITISAIFGDDINKLSKLLHINSEWKIWRFFQSLRTFLLFTIGIAITRAHNVAEIKTIGCRILKYFNFHDLTDGGVFDKGLDCVDFSIAVISLLLILGISCLQEKKSVRQILASQKAIVRWVVYSLSLAIIILFGIYGNGCDASEFAYAYF